MVLEWTLGLKRLAYSNVSLHLKGNMGDQNHQTFCVSLVLVSFTLIYRAACSLLVKHSTIIISEEKASEISSYQLLGTLRCLLIASTKFSVLGGGGGGGGGLHLAGIFS